MSVGSVNLPGSLLIGGLASTTSVSIGKGGALVIDNTGTGASGSVAVAGSMTSAGPLGIGTNPLTCGALSSGAITAGGTVSCGTFGLTCGALSSGAHTASGTVSCGTFGMTCGALSCASVASAGAVTQPRFWLRARVGSPQAVSTSTFTDVSFTGDDTVNGGSSGWTVSYPSTSPAAPAAGMYVVTWALSWAVQVGGLRETFLRTSTNGTWNDSQLTGQATWVTTQGGSAVVQLAAGETLIIRTWQSSGSTINITACTLHAYRLSE